MSATPETDDQPIIYAMNDNGYQVPCVDLEFARRLKRERDEARELLASEKITRDHVIKRGIEMQKERDEAREQNAKLRDIADRAIIPLECDGVPWGAKLRAELDQLKEGRK
jgi:hypothetical protein